MPDWSLETWRTLAIILSLACLLLLRTLWGMVRRLAKAERLVDMVQENCVQLQERYYRTRDDADTWRMRYETLDCERKQEADLEDGEEYVRKSLGLSSNEDHEESA